MKLILADMPIKQFMRLFDPKATISNLKLGDTMHPASGYIDESYLGGLETVEQFISQEYDFPGLVYLEVSLQNITATYHEDNYCLQGTEKELAKLINRIRMLNAQDSCDNFSILIN